HRLFEVRVAGILRAHLRLIDAQIGRAERPLHEVDDVRMHDEPGQVSAPVEGELAGEAVLLGAERGAGVGHLRIAAPQLLGAAPRRTVRDGVGEELLRLREHVPQILYGRVDLRSADESVDERPTFLAPRRDLVVARPSTTHLSSALASTAAN